MNGSGRCPVDHPVDRPVVRRSRQRNPWLTGGTSAHRARTHYLIMCALASVSSATPRAGCQGQNWGGR